MLNLDWSKCQLLRVWQFDPTSIKIKIKIKAGLNKFHGYFDDLLDERSISNYLAS